MIEGSESGSNPLTNGSGSRRPKNTWIRWIRIRNTGRSSFTADNIVTFFKKIVIQLGVDPLLLVDSQLFMTTVSDEGPVFLWRLDDFDAGKSITRAIERGGP